MKSFEDVPGPLMGRMEDLPIEKAVCSWIAEVGLMPEAFTGIHNP